MYDAWFERDLEGDTVHEECGVFGVYAPGADNMRPQENWVDLMLDPRQT